MRNFLGLLLGLAVTAAAQQTPAMFKLTGTVVDAATQAPLPGSEVQVSPVGKPQLLESVMADSVGHFEFNNLFAGKYSLSAVHTGYLPETYQQHGQYSTGVAVGPNLNSTGLVFPLPRQAVISGIIMDQENEPVPNANIQLLREMVVEGIRMTRYVGGTATNSDGRYSIGKLAAGTYYLAVTAQPWYAQQYMAMGIVPSAEATETQIAAPKFDVSYPLTFYPSVTSDSAAAPVKLLPGAAVELNVTLTAVPAVHINVERTNGANANAHLQYVTRWGELFRPNSMFFNNGGQTFAIAPGRYQMSAQWHDKTGAHAVNRIMDISGNTTIDPRTMETQKRITATLAGTGNFPESVLHSLLLRDASTGQVWRPSITEGNVTWPARELAANRYELLFNSAEDYYIQNIEAVNAKVSGRSIELNQDGPVQLKLTLAKGRAEMKGRVEQAGTPVSGAMVLLLRDDYSTSPALTRRDQSDSDGTFSLAGIVPGRYTLLALPTNSELEYAKPEVIGPFLAHGKKVVVEPGKQYQATAELINSAP